MRLFFGISLLLVFSLSSLNGQRFSAAAVGGINTSQIDGDGLAGYHKWGITGGVKVSYEIYDRMDLSIEMLLNQKGSRSTSDFFNYQISLNYVDIPLVYSFKDWYQDDQKYYKARLDVGFSYGYLISSTKNIDGLEEDITDFNINDFSVLAGVGYNFNKHLGMSVRYSRSMNKVYKSPNEINPDLISYFLSVRAEYTF